jgi:hypothetical protein
MYQGADSIKTTSAPQTNNPKREIVPAEQRKAARKTLKTKAILAMNGEEPVTVHTLDIGMSGISLAVPHPLSAGQLGQIAFSIFFDGKPHHVNAFVKLAHCVFGGNEFKAGFMFTKVDSAGTSAIAQYFQQP